MISISIHSRVHPVTVTMEIPANSGMVQISDGKGKLEFYLPVSQWRALRKVFPKGEGYTMHTHDDRTIWDHAEADAYAETYYLQQIVPSEAPPPPEPNALSDNEVVAQPANHVVFTQPNGDGIDEIVDMKHQSQMADMEEGPLPDVHPSAGN